MEGYKGDLGNERTCSYQATLNDNKYDYEFGTKNYTSFAVEVTRSKNEVTIS